MVKWEYFLKGYSVNFFVTMASVSMLIVWGILLTLLAKKVPVIGKILGWLSVPFECICPVALIVFIYYFALEVDGFLYDLTGSYEIYPLIVAIVGLSVAYMGYMPSRFMPEYSFWKNTIYNGLGMISAIFKWSFCLRLIGISDILYYGQVFVNRTFRTGATWVPLLVGFFSLLLIEVARRIVKQFMK